MIFAFNKANGVHDAGISICLIMIIINSKHKESTYMPHLINIVVNNRLMFFIDELIAVRRSCNFHASVPNFSIHRLQVLAPTPVASAISCQVCPFWRMRPALRLTASEYR